MTNYSTEFHFIDIYGRGDFPEVGVVVEGYQAESNEKIDLVWDGQYFYFVNYENVEFAGHTKIQFVGSWRYKAPEAKFQQSEIPKFEQLG